MANEKQVKGVLIPRHDTAINWSKAANFVPNKGELIVFDADATSVSYTIANVTTTKTMKNKDGSTGTLTECDSSTQVRLKVGDGNLNVNLLPFVKTGLTADDLANLNDDIVVSATEPVVTGETIWLQPITTDTGAIDYIVEQNISDNTYYEKWNSGIIKYFANSTVAATTTSRTNIPVRIDVPKTICKSIIYCNADGYGAMGAGSTTYELKQVSDNTSQNVFSINGVFSSLSANETGKVYISVVGKWK